MPKKGGVWTALLNFPSELLLIEPSLCFKKLN